MARGEFGMSIISHDPAFQWVPKGTMSYNEDANQYATYDVALAESLMKEAGYKKGFETTITFLNMNPYNGLYTMVQNQLAEIGITVKLDAADPGRLFQSLAGGWHMPCSGMVSRWLSGWMPALRSIPGFQITPWRSAPHR